ncbi:unnamed protein product, partial [Allacma fusca]
METPGTSSQVLSVPSKPFTNSEVMSCFSEFQELEVHQTELHSTHDAFTMTRVDLPAASEDQQVNTSNQGPNSASKNELLRYLVEINLKLDRLETKVDLLHRNQMPHCIDMDADDDSQFPFSEYTSL